MTLKEFIPVTPKKITNLLCGRPDPRAALSTVREIFDDWAFVDEVDRLVGELFRRAGRPIRAPKQLNAAPLSDRALGLDPDVFSLIEEYHGDVELYRLLSELRASEIASRAAAPIATPSATSADQAPVFTVLTPSLNSERDLVETMESVIGQEGNFWIRYHIQDCGSGDAALEVVRRWHHERRPSYYSSPRGQDDRPR